MKGAILTKGQALFDVTVVLSLAAGYVAAENLSLPKRWIFPVIALTLLGFGVHAYRRGGESLGDLGFSRAHLGPASRGTALFTLIASGGIVAYAAMTGSRLWYPSMAILLPLYPIYGLVQQAIFQGILHRRIAILTPTPGLAILLTSFAFALVHTGNTALVALTFVAGLGWSWIYSRHANLWPLGLSHGLLAAIAYPLILGDNPLQRL